MINLIELNVILYYADFLSLKEKSISVTDNCKYYFVYNSPINSAYTVDLEPIFDPDNKYYIQAYTEYTTLKDKFGEDGVLSFIERICNLSSLGCINAEQMLKCIHHYSYKADRKQALDIYYKWRKNQKFEHLITNENGDQEWEECSRYIAHNEWKDNTKRVRYTEGTRTIESVQTSN